MRARRGQRGLWDEIIVDSFAGGGGASLGIEQALGRPVDIAINHDADAIAMHEENHPSTRHYHEDVWKVDPLEATAGRPVGILWASPDCTHHSRAKGGKPLKKHIRGLAWMVIRWARVVRPRVILLENVQELEDWGPLVNDRPCPRRKGVTFKRWVGSLRAAGYQVEWRVLRACDYGAPTTRKRLFLIARCDGAPILWPERTHGEGLASPWRTAAECIQWEIPCPSIFERAKPLAEKTQARIAEGIRRFVLHHADPFLFPVTHQGDLRAHSIREPMRTITAAHRGEFALASPSLIQRSWGERKGQTPRALDIQKPLGTIVAGGIKHALVAAWLAKHFGGVYGNHLEQPVGTVTSRDHHSVVASTLEKMNERDGSGTAGGIEGPDRGSIGRDGLALEEREVSETARLPSSSRVCARQRIPGSDDPDEWPPALGACPSLDLGGPSRSDSGGYRRQPSGHGPDEQLSRESGTGYSLRKPSPRLSERSQAPTEDMEGFPREGDPRGASTRDRAQAVGRFLLSHLGGDRDSLRASAPHLRIVDDIFWLRIEGEDWAISDIGMRMLQPRELYRAQGFPDSYVIEQAGGRRLTKTAQIRMVGNSVPPPCVEAIVRANVRASAQVASRRTA